MQDIYPNQKLPVSEVISTRKLINSVLEISENRLSVDLDIFQLDNNNRPIPVHGAPKTDRLICKEPGTTDQGRRED
jgi:hypothetical protein